jgi:hypothetical protein
MEADAETDTPNLAKLKRILHERIAAIEANGGIANLQPFSSAPDTPRKGPPAPPPTARKTAKYIPLNPRFLRHRGAARCHTLHRYSFTPF